MKTFLKILLAANFLLQISLEKEELQLEQNKKYQGTADGEPNQGEADPHQDYDKESQKEGYGGADPEQYPGTEDSFQPSDNVIYPDDIVPCDSISTDKEEVQDDILNYHNVVRSSVNPPGGNILKMEWSDTIMESAKKWADTCNFNHSEEKDRMCYGTPLGENIVNSPVCVTWFKAMLQWFNEKVYLIWGVGRKGENVTGHYTQMVTDYTFKLGCAVTNCAGNGRNGVFYVCQYFPPGNRASSLYQPYDKGEPCSLCPKNCDTNLKLCLNSCNHTDKATNCKPVEDDGVCEDKEQKEMCEATCLCKQKIT